MSNKNKYIPLPGGETCKRVTTVTFPHHPDSDNPILAITEVMPEGVEFSGSEVWQYHIPVIDDWLTSCRETHEKYNDFNSYKSDYALKGFPTRIAIKPLKAKYPVKKEYNVVMKTYTPVCPTCKNKHPQFCSDSFHINPANNPIVDVVENKEERVEDAQIKIGDTCFTKLQDGFIQILTKNGCVELIPDEIIELANFINTKKSRPIEGIVGFVLEAAKYAYDYHANSQFPEMSFEDNCKNNLLQWMQGKSDIIKEYNNGK